VSEDRTYSVESAIVVLFNRFIIKDFWGSETPQWTVLEVVSLVSSLMVTVLTNPASLCNLNCVGHGSGWKPPPSTRATRGSISKSVMQPTP